MEGKAVLFKEFADVDAFPICLDTKDEDEIVRTVEAIAPVFGGINLEDISAPRCFSIEARLRESLDIPVFHDDQHGTAIVVLAALLNALRVVDKRIEDIRVVTTGCGAAGMAVTRALQHAGVSWIVGCDEGGALYRGRARLNPAKREYAETTNPDNLRGTADEVLAGADVFIGVSVPGAISVEGVRRMAPRAIVFAMANPNPEVDPEAIEDLVEVIATGRIDKPLVRSQAQSETTSSHTTTSSRASSIGPSRPRLRRLWQALPSRPASRAAPRPPRIPFRRPSRKESVPRFKDALSDSPGCNGYRCYRTVSFR
jgi:malate dehydrogenase (oxaloacetate-decarboxylating)